MGLRQGASRFLRLASVMLRECTAWIDQYSERSGCRPYIAQKLEPLQPERSREQGDAGDVAARAAAACDQPTLHRIAADHEDDGDC